MLIAMRVVNIIRMMAVCLNVKEKKEGKTNE